MWFSDWPSVGNKYQFKESSSGRAPGRRGRDQSWNPGTADHIFYLN